AEKAQERMNQPILPAFFPVAVGDKVIYRSHRLLVAVFIKDGQDAAGHRHKAGEMAWTSVMDGSLTRLVEPPKGDGGNQTVLADWKNRYQTMMSNLIVENSMVGTVSADQDKCYTVDDLAILPHPYWLQQWAWGGQPTYPQAFHDLMKQSTLRAFD